MPPLYAYDLEVVKFYIVSVTLCVQKKLVMVIIFWRFKKCLFLSIFNRPNVAGAVLTTVSIIDLAFAPLDRTFRDITS